MTYKIDIESFISTLELISDSHDLDNTHGQRTADLCTELALLIDREEFKLSEEEILFLQYAARIHDLGRVGVDNSIIAKPGRLTQSQKAAMREHVKIGFDLLQKSSLPRFILEGMLYHHEHYDGTGYPENLSGNEIPIAAKIICICDTWDGIKSKRPYHDQRTFDEALREMNKISKWFDPYLYGVFLKLLHQVKR